MDLKISKKDLREFPGVVVHNNNFDLRNEKNYEVLDTIFAQKLNGTPIHLKGLQRVLDGDDGPVGICIIFIIHKKDIAFGFRQDPKFRSLQKVADDATKTLVMAFEKYSMQETEEEEEEEKEDEQEA